METKQTSIENNVTVLGWYDQSNIGDESYKIAFPKIFPNYNFKFTSKLVGDEKKIILGGGNVLNESFLKELSKCPEAEKYLMSVDLGNCPLAPFLFNKIISRNKVNNQTDQPTIQTSDFAFILEANADNGRNLIKKMFDEKGLELYENVIIVVMNSFLCVRQGMLARDQLNFDKVCQELATLSDNTNASFIFLPFGNGFPHNDRIANSMVYSKCKFWKKNCLVYDQIGVQDTLDICAAVNLVISTRLHSSIFAAIGETPFIDLCHHDKTKSFMNWYGNSDCLFDYWHLDYNGLKSKVDKLLYPSEKYLLSLKTCRQDCHDTLADLKNKVII